MSFMTRIILFFIIFVDILTTEMKHLLPIVAILAIIPLSCSKEEASSEYPAGDSEIPYVYPAKNGDMIPDFSHVGYHYGEEEPPVLPVTKVLVAPVGDATEYIQKAIDESAGGAVLLKSGTYNVSGTIYLNKSGVVLRGDGEGKTIITGTGKTQRSLIVVGGSSGRELDWNSSTDVAEMYVPVGRYYLDVIDASRFSKGDDVVIYRPGTDEWIHDLQMDQIPMASDGGTKQWKASDYNLCYERKVMKVEGNRIWFDNPTVMALDSRYGSGKVMKYSYSGRVSECGVENMTLYSTTNGQPEDEAHCWTAVHMKNVEHSWVRNITSKQFGYCCVDIAGGSKNITVDGCTSLDPVSIITGSRRYAFHISGGQLCLVKNCLCDYDRHQYVTGARVCGPNVFIDSKSTHSHSDAGPHHRWATGVLYDNIVTDGNLDVQDRGNLGSGHGWTGANFVLWNCTAKAIACQNPWVAGQNWCIGCKAKKISGTKYKDRPDGLWASKDKPVTPASLYKAQKSLPSHINVWEELGRI